MRLAIGGVHGCYGGGKRGDNRGGGLRVQNQSLQGRGGRGGKGNRGFDLFKVNEGHVIQHCYLENCRALINKLMERVDTTKRLCHEEHAEQMTTLMDRMHYLQCQVWERLVVVWRGQNQLTKKL